jgi:hypothetical protein
MSKWLQANAESVNLNLRLLYENSCLYSKDVCKDETTVQWNDGALSADKETGELVVAVVGNELAA